MTRFMKKADKKRWMRTVMERLGPGDLLYLPIDGDLQDGMLSYYNEQAPFADANVEARIEKTPLTGLNPFTWLDWESPWPRG